MSRPVDHGELSKQELVFLLDAVRAMAEASAEPDFARAIDALLGAVARATGSDRSDLYRLDEAARELVLVGVYPRVDAAPEPFRALPLHDSRTGAALLAGRAATWTIDEVRYHADAARGFGVRHVAAVPLVAGRSSPSVVLNLARHGDEPYTERELRFAATVGELLVVYVENAELYADAHRRLDDTRLLLDVGRAVSASIEIDQLLATATDVLRRIVNASNAYVMLVEDDGQALRGVATSNDAAREEFRRVRTPLSSSSIAARAVSSRRPVAVIDATDSSDVRRDLVERYAERSLLALPLLVQDRPIGAVVVDDTRRSHTWSAREIESAELVAQQIAAGLANARLYEQVRQRSVALERAQQELVKRERLAALGQLAATLAHEVRNPIGVLFNAIGMLRRQLPDDASGGTTGDAATLLAIMAEEAQRLERLVRELLDFARPLAPTFELESLAGVVAGAVDAAARELGTTGAVPRLDLQVPDDLPPVRLDASMVRRAVVNLVINGVQAAGPSGAVTVRASIETSGARRVARIDVTDTGPGIAPEHAGRVFEPFFTTKATGTGLGLAVVKSIVESHGGEIAIASSDAGTTVSLLIPCEPLEPPTAAGPPIADQRDA